MTRISIRIFFVVFVQSVSISAESASSLRVVDRVPFVGSLLNVSYHCFSLMFEVYFFRMQLFDLN